MATISTDEAEALLDDGVPFIDVRTIEEFADGHVPAALNVPVSLSAPGGMAPNPDFVEVMSGLFAKDQKLIVSCKAGGRSARAVALLEADGFTSILDMSSGFEGSKDAFGQFVPGWSAEGREIEVDADEEQLYSSLKAQAGK